jgi:tyrosyl-tRNA synthetase
VTEIDLQPRPLAGLLDELRWRGMLHEHTPGLPERLASGRAIAGYTGFDPSGPSLHIGHLIPIFGLIQLQRHGGRPVALVGGATGMVGDPSGRSSERNLLDRDALEANVKAVRGQLERYLDFGAGPGGAVLVNNLDWTGEVRLLDFLRDVGKHFTVPYMLGKDSVQGRLERGLSFTEFSYMLLQAADFAHLYRAMGVELQMGGADQWGNITAGLELIRRSATQADGEAAHALAYPLLTNPSGEKFGKTAEGTSVWLDPGLTTPFAFYQHWVQAADPDVPVYLRSFTLMEREEIEALEADLVARPERRAGQRALARDLTARTHGEEVTRRVIAASEAAFAREPVEDPAVLEMLHRELDHFEIPAATVAAGVVDLLVGAGIAPSRSEARRLLEGGAVTINGRRIVGIDDAVPDPIAGAWLQVWVGKRRRWVGRIDP